MLESVQTNMCINNSSCHMEILQGIAYTPLCVVGLLLNSAALYVFIAKRTSWTDTHIYMVNLAMADFALLLLLPFRIYNAFYCIEKTILCTFLISIHYINMYASILSSTAISVHRYLAVRFPVQTRGWKRKKQVAAAVCVSIWVLVLSISVAYRESHYPDKLATCYERNTELKLPVDFLVTVGALGYLCPLLIIVLCSGQIVFTLSKVRDSLEKKNTLDVVKANAIVFVVCFTPIHVSLALNNLSGHEDSHTETSAQHIFFLLSEWIASTNCCLDALSYYFMVKQFYVLADDPA